MLFGCLWWMRSLLLVTDCWISVVSDDIRRFQLSGSIDQKYRNMKMKGLKR